MTPYTRASTSRSIALRMKALQMKRACKTVPITAVVQNANTRKQAPISPKKSPKKLETKIGEGKSNLADSATPKEPESKCKGKKAKLKQSVTVKSKASKSNSKSKKQSKSSKSMPSDEDEEDEDATGLKAEIGVEIVKETAKKILDLGDDENMDREEKVKETDGEKNMVPILEKINKRMHAKEGQIDQMITVLSIAIANGSGFRF
ncbi:hypothetical protein M0R45_000364 [Rubus argutus]|uniref:Uncharacterized protein n=1 Tax=Rubus argutus TaxID=59490 RepID=A0AAW1VKY8_RUBAR